MISRLSNAAWVSDKHYIFKNSVTVRLFPGAISQCCLPYNALFLSPENKHLVCLLRIIVYFLLPSTKVTRFLCEQWA